MSEIPQYSEEDMQINAESADINEVTNDNVADPDLRINRTKDLEAGYEIKKVSKDDPEYEFSIL